jgi:multiple sugar transport system substrate-binding protein
MKTVFRIQTTLMLLCLFALIFVSACGSGSELAASGSTAGDKPKPVTEKAKPVELGMYTYNANVTDEDFQALFVEPLKKKYPYITLILVRIDLKKGAAEILNSGSSPDLIYTGNPTIPVFKDLDLPIDLNAMVKKNKLNLSVYDPVIINTIKKYGANGELYGLPFAVNYGVLFANKDIFDKFGVEYPRDLMKWDEVLELSKKLTRSDGGINYKGFSTPNLQFFGEAMSLPYIDPKTERPLLDSDGWKRVFELGQRIFDVPGFREEKKVNFGRGNYLNDRNLAMIPDFVNGVVPQLETFQKSGKPLNWDMYAMPNFPEFLGKTRYVDTHLLMVAKTSKHPDDAFKVASYISASPEVQMLVSKSGKVTPLKDAAIKKELGKNLETIKGKNINAIIKAVPAEMPNPTIYDDIIKKELKKAMDKVGNNTDINTALREAVDAAEKSIAAEKQK